MTEDARRERALLDRVVADRLGGVLLAAEPLTGGYSGAGVSRVRARLPAGEREFVLKTSPPRDAPEEDDEERVYGAHPSSLGAVHALLRSRGLPTYDLIRAGAPTPDLPVHWAAMSELGGASVARLGSAPDQDGLQRVLGEALGAVHAVTRAHDGPVDRATPHASAWADAFFASFEGILARELDPLGYPDLAAGLRGLAERHRRTWTPPAAYALSHVDGLQGHAVRDGSSWRFVGHVDLEDFVFLDARFALAGYEESVSGRAPPAFWEGYRSVGAVPDGYAEARDLLRAYFLANWLWLEDQRPRLLAKIGGLLAGAG